MEDVVAPDDGVIVGGGAFGDGVGTLVSPCLEGFLHGGHGVCVEVLGGVAMPTTAAARRIASSQVFLAFLNRAADITRRNWAVNVRKFIARVRRLDDLVRGGSLTPTVARFLDAAVDSGMNILVSGATPPGGEQRGLCSVSGGCATLAT